ncbi:MULTISPECIES: DUF4845 domain-containing protein [Pseudomonadaceae]|uniref:DUF4845 domain-containing protein n=1 Tax=Pseudomonadaceae TaxID=135621 RepID=UPI00187D51B4|nr:MULTISPECIES: DUF4845 domain-containing protein [Pseudomonadaceae]MBE7928859.1 DUF4845 domain-containing protein [Pseudomonas saudiphocaensis]MCF6782286.1 DUF4845 domain-containing protein [Stutzerimonas stutzeri]MCF6805392.1 DUF4845 domain-containing protein [Stutzerimonas stutzeri]
MSFARSQKGLSMLSWIVMLALVAFVASTAFKMLPHYFDYMSMDKIISGVESDKATEVRSVRDFYTHVSRGMDVNGIRGLDLKEALKVEIENNEFRVHLNYEKREPLIRNLDLVANFDKEYRLRMP